MILKRLYFYLCIISLYGFVPTSHAEQKLNLLVVGDSLSAAYNLAEEQGWVYLLQQRIDLQSEYGARYRVVNASVGGATSAAALQRIPSLLQQYQPHIVILEMGANDGLQGKPIPYITRNLGKLIELSQKAGAKVVLTGIHLPPNYGKRYTEPFFNQYKLLSREYDLPLVPFLLEDVATHNHLMQADRLHPTAEAQSIVLDNVWVILEKLM
ncbi:arylesterase [Teredinibacter haidensis]|uniref:arylesterase n=1 Tax=Teredinibacter haidensis TaxID=2731755 RepID=UPI0009F8AF0C|nr:arylesterase [Teredinibacter haidensis]